MADKGKRIASRQAQLKRKKRRGKGGSQQFDAGPSEAALAEAAARADEGDDASASVPETAAADSASGGRPRPVTSAPAGRATGEAPRSATAPARAPRRSRAAGRTDAAVVYPYLGVELRHIGVIAAVLGVALVGLTFLLR